MLSLKSVSYKTRLISLYVGTTLLGIILTLFAINNASQEQLILDHINTMYSVFSDRLQQHVAGTQNVKQPGEALSTQHYRVLPVSQDAGDSVSIGDCNLSLTSQLLEQQRMNARGGVTGEADCLFSWVMLRSHDINNALLVVHQLDVSQRQSIVAAYTNRLVIPLLFFIWMAVWGSLMLGNLVNRLQRQKQEVEHMAMHDTLTGLPNREYFSAKVSEVISYSSRHHEHFVLALVDLNKFKSVNDELGHQYGDLLLKQVAQRFKDAIRDYDVAARLGGDEFILLLPGTDIDSSMQILERIYHSIIEEYVLLDKVVIIGASIGVSYFPEHDTSHSELVHKADMAMYLAKQSGGGIRLFDAVLTTPATDT